MCFHFLENDLPLLSIYAHFYGGKIMILFSFLRCLLIKTIFTNVDNFIPIDLLLFSY